MVCEQTTRRVVAAEYPRTFRRLDLASFRRSEFEFSRDRQPTVAVGAYRQQEAPFGCSEKAPTARRVRSPR